LGTQSHTRTCSGSCAWGAWGGWSSCSGGGACAPTSRDYDWGGYCPCPGDVRERSRTCSGSCSWGVWGSWGSCSNGIEQPICPEEPE
jgi:hypothetical protein